MGIAFTDVDFISGNPNCSETTAVMWVYGAAGNEIGFGTTPFDSLGSCRGETADDIFTVWQGTEGVSRIRVAYVASNQWEVDHLTAALAAPIPEPGTWALMALGLAAAARRAALRAAPPQRA